MSELKLTGTIKTIGEIQTFNEFRKVEFSITTSGEYPQIVKFEVTKDKIEDFLKYNKVGKEVEVSFNIRGREWTNKEGIVIVFNSLNAWKVFKSENAVTEQAPPAPTEEEQAPF